MFNRFTEGARKVMVLARQEANGLRNDYIGTEHILVGLVLEGRGVAAQTLMNFDVDVRAARAEVERLVKKGGGSGNETQLPFSPRVKRMLEQALKEALDLGHDDIGTEHLLLGLIGESAGPGARALQNLGVGPDRIREHVLELIGKSTMPPGQEARRVAVEAILRKRLAHLPPSLQVPGAIEIQVRSVHGPKGWGFQLWLGHTVEGEFRTELAAWVDAVETLEEHFASTVELFVRLVRSSRDAKRRIPDPPAGGEGPVPPAA